jgi:aminobenzoyl-glutamate utilization protein B
LNAGAKVMAASAIDLMTMPDRLAEIREEFDGYAKNHPYKSFLPEDSQPPVDINEEIMNRFRPAMEETYVKESRH